MKNQEEKTPTIGAAKNNQKKTQTPEAKVKENQSEENKQTGDARGKVGQPTNRNSPQNQQQTNSKNPTKN